MSSKATVALTIGLITATMAAGQNESDIDDALLTTPPAVRKMQIALHITQHALIEDWRLAYKNAESESEFDDAEGLLEEYEEAEVVVLETAFETVDNFFLADINDSFLDPMEVQLVDRIIDEITYSLEDYRKKDAQARGFDALMLALKLLDYSL